MKRVLVIGVVATAALCATGTIAYAAGSSGSASGNQKHPAAHRALPAAAIDTTTESKFTSIAPCRAVDTRSSGGGGAYSNNTTRSYDLATSCSVPNAATAVAATITTVATHPGYLKAWASGASEPPTSFMNYGTSFNASSGGVIPVQASTIRVKNHAGPTQVIIDITGYYIKPMYAYVEVDGTLNTSMSSPRAMSSQSLNGVDGLGAGTYQVNFDRDVSHCGYAVTSDTNAIVSYAEPRDNDADGVFVELTDRSSNGAASAFYLTVTC